MAAINEELKQQAKELWLEGKKYKEISEITGIKESSIKSLASRLWKKEKLQPSKKKVAVAKKVATKNNAPPIEELTKEEIDTLANEELTEKQRLFCLYYTRYFNATRAYKKAYGCTDMVALANGSRLLGNDRIKEEIKHIKDAKIKKSMFDVEDLFQKYMDIAFGDITEFLSFGRENMIIDGIEIPDIKINTMKLKESEDVDGTLIESISEGKNGISIKLISKEFALKWLDKNYGVASEEQRARIDQMKAQTKKLEDNDIVPNNDLTVKIEYGDSDG